MIHRIRFALAHALLATAFILALPSTLVLIAATIMEPKP